MRDSVQITSLYKNNTSNSLFPSTAQPLQNDLFTARLPFNQMHCCQALCPLIWSWTRWLTAASHHGLSRRGLGILGIPQSAKIIDNALSLTPGWGIDEWLEGHKSDSCGSTPCHTLTHPPRSPIKWQTHGEYACTQEHTLCKPCTFPHIYRYLHVNTRKYTIKQPLYTHMHTLSHTLPQLKQNGWLKITATNLVLNLSICARFKNKEQCRETKLDPFVLSLCLSSFASSVIP